MKKAPRTSDALASSKQTSRKVLSERRLRRKAHREYNRRVRREAKAWLFKNRYAVVYGLPNADEGISLGESASTLVGTEQNTPRGDTCVSDSDAFEMIDHQSDDTEDLQ